jgi:hypothetical protein
LEKLLLLFYYFCLNNSEDDKLERFFANGFWYFSHFIKDWSTHENFREKNNFPIEYYNEVYELIYNFSYWYFMKEPAFCNSEEYLVEINNLKRYIN